MNALQIFAIIALAAFTVLSVYAVFALRQLAGFLKKTENSVEKATKDVEDIKGKLLLALDDFQDLKKTMASTLESVNEIEQAAIKALLKATETMTYVDSHANELMGMAKDAQSKANGILGIAKPFEDLSIKVYEKVAPPVVEAANVVSAGAKAIIAFADTLQSRFKK